MTFLGGLLIAIGADISTKYVITVNWLSGLPASLPFLVLFVVLLVTPRRRLVPSGTILRRAAAALPRAGRGAADHRSAGRRALALVPVLVSDIKLPFFTVGLTQIIILLSLGLLVRTSGQVSLCHSVFAAIGAVAFSQFAVDHHWPWLVSVLVGALVLVPVGALVAIPAIRLSGLFLGLATFGFGILVEQLLYSQNFMFTPLATGRAMPRPSFAQGDVAFYYLVLAFVVVVAVAHHRDPRVTAGAHPARARRRAGRHGDNGSVDQRDAGASSSASRRSSPASAASLRVVGPLRDLERHELHVVLLPRPARRAGSRPVRRAVVRRLHGRRGGHPRLHQRRARAGLAQRDLRLLRQSRSRCRAASRRCPTGSRPCSSGSAAGDRCPRCRARSRAHGSRPRAGTDATRTGLAVSELGVRFGGLVAVKSLSASPRRSAASPASSARTAPARRRPSTRAVG